MSVGTPIICVAPQNSALARLVKNEKIGEVFQALEINAISIFIENCILFKSNYDCLVNNNLKLSLKYSRNNASLLKS
jgi:hypothetical protein